LTTLSLLLHFTVNSHNINIFQCWMGTSLHLCDSPIITLWI